jgi:hypothetical protein
MPTEDNTGKAMILVPLPCQQNAATGLLRLEPSGDLSEKGPYIWLAWSINIRYQPCTVVGP